MVSRAYHAGRISDYNEKPEMKALTCIFSGYLIFLSTAIALAAEDRVTKNVEPTQLAQLKGHLNPRARAEFDRGRVDPALRIQYATLYLKPAAGLETFLADQ